MNSLTTMNRFNILVLSVMSLVLTGSRWPSLTSSYAIHCIIGRPVGQGGCTGQSALKDWRYQIRDAKDSWNSAGNFTIVWVHESAPNNCSCTNLNTNDNINVITAETSYNPEATWYAEANVVSDANGNILDADIAFSPSHLPIIGDGTGGTLNVRSIILHEFGHFLGLGHSSSSTDVMYSSYNGSTTIGQESINSLASLYPTQQQEPPEGGGNHCGSSTMMMLHPFRNQLLFGMRQVRDQLLSKTESGRGLIKAYYEFSPEVIRYAARHPFWALEAASKLSKLAPLFSGHMNQPSKTAVSITAEDLNEVLSLLERVRSDASPKLRSFLDRLMPKIERGRAYEPFALLSAIL